VIHQRAQLAGAGWPTGELFMTNITLWLGVRRVLDSATASA
jgi:hypothetical protein